MIYKKCGSNFKSKSFSQGFIHSINCLKMWRRFILNTDKKYKIGWVFWRELNNDITCRPITKTWLEFVRSLVFSGNNLNNF